MNSQITESVNQFCELCKTIITENTQTINFIKNEQSFICCMTCKNIRKGKSGRPKLDNRVCAKDYNKQYYQINKKKYKGYYFCDVCQQLSSISNKSRHIKSKFHLNAVDLEINHMHEVFDELNINPYL